MPTSTPLPGDRAEILLDLFTEIAIIDRLCRARIDTLTPAGLSIQQFGILNYFLRAGKTSSRLSTIVWVFQEPERALRDDIEALTAMGFLEIEDRADGAIVHLTEAGVEKHRQAFARVAPSFSEMLGDFSDEQLHQTASTLVEIRRTMDNQPDR